MTKKEMFITTALTFLFFWLFAGEVGLLTTFVVAVVWFMFWCVISIILPFVHTLRD